MMTALKVFGLTLGFSFALCPIVLADQCAYITKEQGMAALSRLEPSQTIYQLCELCGETIPEPIQIKNLSLIKVNYEHYWEILVNHRGIDLAYSYVDAGIENQLLNLAAIANCPADSVSITVSKPDTEIFSK